MIINNYAGHDFIETKLYNGKFTEEEYFAKNRGTNNVFYTNMYFKCNACGIIFHIKALCKSFSLKEDIISCNEMIIKNLLE